MSAVEEIQAAIDRLTAEREASTQPTDGNSWIQGRDSRRYESSSEVFTGPDENTDGSADIVSYIEPEDARLIVTLHRTIDAQLGILTYAANGVRLFDRTPYTIEIDLARAINRKETK